MAKKYRVEYELEVEDGHAYKDGDRFLYSMYGFNYRLPNGAKVTDITPKPPNGWYQCTDECMSEPHAIFYVCENQVYEVVGHTYGRPSLLAYEWDIDTIGEDGVDAEKAKWFKRHKIVMEQA